jgi:hypothetical protein
VVVDVVRRGGTSPERVSSLLDALFEVGRLLVWRAPPAQASLEVAVAEESMAAIAEAVDHQLVGGDGRGDDDRDDRHGPPSGAGVRAEQASGR